MNIAIVGCGYVADYYLATLRLHPELQVMGLYDRQPDRLRLLSGNYSLPTYGSFDELLRDGRVGMVLNLTNPREHYAVSKAALEAGKHVYSEKPLAMEMQEARELVQLAESRDLIITSAPCSLLGETAQTIGVALRENIVGRVRVVYAEIDDGMVHRMAFRKWKSVSGLPWPYKDEFEVGCTLEHAGYYLTWLLAFFGQAVSVTAFGSIQVEDKVPGETLNMQAPDFTVAGIQFSSGVVARLTCSILAPHDHSLKIVGDEGVLYTDDCWNYRSPVYSRSLITIRRKTLLSPWRKSRKLPEPPYGKPRTQGAQSMDFARGPAEVAAALRERRSCRLSPHFALHVNELVLAIHAARAQHGASYRMTTSFDPIALMPWAR